MTTQFLSRVERSLQADPAAATTPGAYSSSSTFKKSLPSFAPFSSNTKRIVATSVPTDEGPAPGSYDLSRSLIKQTSYGIGTYESKSERFKEAKPDAGPGPGTYAMPTAFDNVTRKKTRSARSHLLSGSNEALQKGLSLAAQKPPPSIPNKFQSYGYEMTNSGELKLQQPLYPVYKGSGDSAVGPGDYDPHDRVRYRNTPAANFGKMAPRDVYAKLEARVTEAPGPGYYNARSDFDVPEEGNTFTDTSFLMQLNAVRKKQSSAFESKTSRDAMMQEIKRKLHEPGPGAYNIPSSMTVKPKDAAKQHLGSSTDRFRDPLPRSMRITTAPGTYSPITSDFDKLRLNIMKQKKMASRSGWTQNIAFASTESRFYKPGGPVNDVPPPSVYFPKTGIADKAPKQKQRGGAFGAKEERFKAAKTNYDPIRDPYYHATKELNKDLQHLLPQDGHNPRKLTKPRYSSVFAPSENERLKPPKTPPGPPPGAYDTAPKWNRIGTKVMAPLVGESRKQHDVMPGPGQYTLPGAFQSNRRNPKNIMVSSSSRDSGVFGRSRSDCTPGPGDYDPIPFTGSMIKPSHNVLLSDDVY